jgi:predicted dehydrogenase
METRFGVVGTAHWATSVHSVGLQRTPGARLVGVWGRDLEKTRALAVARSVAPFARFEDMLAEVDAVSFAVPPQIQEELALRALVAGKHVLLEKPIATNARAAEALAAAAERAGIATIVFFMRRFVPEIADFISHHASGGWREAEVEIRSATFAADSPYRNSVWRQVAGSEVWDVGPHVLSILVPMLGPVVLARALASEGNFIRFETEHAGGGRALTRINQRADPGDTRNIYRFRGPSGEVAAPELELDRPANFVRAAGALVDGINDRTKVHPCNVRFGAETVRVLEQIAPWRAT